MSKISELAKQGIYYTPMDEAKPPGQEDGDFVRGVKKAGYQIPQTLGGTAALVGDLTGADGLRDYGMEVYKKNEDKIQAVTKDSDSLTNVLEGNGSAIDWAQNAAGYVGGQALTALATGGAGGFIGSQLAKRGIAMSVARGAESLAAREAAKAAAAKGAKIGAIAGLGTLNLSQEAGSIYPEAVQQAATDGRTLDAGDKARIVGSAIAAAAVDTGMDAFIGHKVLSGGRKAGESMGKAALREVPGMAAKEAATEGVQTGIERYGAGQDLTSADAIRDYVDSMGVGAVGGGLGGGVSVLHARKVPNVGVLSNAANVGIDAQVANLATDPAPLVTLGDGSVTHKADLEAMLTQIDDPDARAAKRAELMGVDEHGQPLVQEAPPPPPPPTSAATPEAEKESLKAWGDQHQPVTLEYAQALVKAPGAKEQDLMVAPHPDGGGFTVVPSNMLTLDTQTRAAALQSKPDGKMMGEPDKAAPAAPEPAPRKPEAKAEPTAPADMTDAQLRTKIDAIKKQAIASGGFTKQFVEPYQVLQDEVRRRAVDNGDPIMNKEGKPFASEFAAKNALRQGLTDSHEITKADDAGGFVLTPKVAATAKVSATVAQVAATVAAPDDMYQQAVDIVNKTKHASISLVQRHLKIGYNRAARLLEQMESKGLVSPMQSNGARTLLTPSATPAAAPQLDLLNAAAHEAATSPTNDLPQPTEGQKDAGNYRKGHISLHGLDISIENPAGSVRSGVDRSGATWENTLKHHYGYIKKTLGADGDHVDAFIGPSPESGKAFVIDQIHPEEGTFDEHKIILGANSLDQARRIYASSYAKGWKGGKNITETSIEGLKAWLTDGDTTKPFAPQSETKSTESATEQPKSVAKPEETATKPAESAPTALDAARQKHARQDEEVRKAAENIAKRKQAKEDQAAATAESAAIPAGNNDAVIPSGNETETPADTGADIPLAFYKKVKVPVEVWIEDEGQFETVEKPAHLALASAREDIASLQALLNCLKG